jgi:PKD repeat protein
VTPLEFRRNLLVRSGGLQLGDTLDATPATVDVQDANVVDNSFLPSAAVDAFFVDRRGAGKVTLRGNDVGGESRAVDDLVARLGVADRGNFPGDAAAEQIDAKDNWWNDSNGPTAPSSEGSGAAIESNGSDAPFPAWSPFSTSVHAIDLCTSFTFAPAAPTIVDTVTFEDWSFDPTGGGLAIESWNFGDGSPDSTGSVATHRYAAAGTYTVTLNVTDERGRVATTSRTVVVKAVAPKASFSYSPSPLFEGETATFQDKSTSTLGTIVAWLWTFGDGTTSSTQRNPTHAYAAQGTYTVRLTITDDHDQSASTSKTIMVCRKLADTPTATIGVSGSQVCTRSTQ